MYVRSKKQIKRVEFIRELAEEFKDEEIYVNIQEKMSEEDIYDYFGYLLNRKEVKSHEVYSKYSPRTLPEVIECIVTITKDLVTLEGDVLTYTGTDREVRFYDVFKASIDELTPRNNDRLFCHEGKVVLYVLDVIDKNTVVAVDIITDSKLTVSKDMFMEYIGTFDDQFKYFDSDDDIKCNDIVLYDEKYYKLLYPVKSNLCWNAVDVYTGIKENILAPTGVYVCTDNDIKYLGRDNLHKLLIKHYDCLVSDVVNDSSVYKPSDEKDIFWWKHDLPSNLVISASVTNLFKPNGYRVNTTEDLVGCVIASNVDLSDFNPTTKTFHINKPELYRILTLADVSSEGGYVIGTNLNGERRKFRMTHFFITHTPDQVIERASTKDEKDIQDLEIQKTVIERKIRSEKITEALGNFDTIDKKLDESKKELEELTNKHMKLYNEYSETKNTLVKAESEIDSIFGIDNTMDPLSGYCNKVVGTAVPIGSGLAFINTSRNLSFNDTIYNAFGDNNE